MAEVLAQAYGLAITPRAVPIYAQSGDQREVNVQKMILKRVEVLPHGLINSREKFGPDGATFKRFAQWVAQQVRQAQADDAGYRPILHFDLYGNAGLAFDLDPQRIASFIAEIAQLVLPCRLHIEAPADFGSTAAQIEGFANIKSLLKAAACDAKIVADEWCDGLDDVRRFAESGAADIVQIKMPDIGAVTKSFEAILLCKAHGVGAYLGGSCSETDLSAKVSVHVAVAGQADMQLAKPGMGVDEALSIIGNEQSRLIARLNARMAGKPPGR
jgi:methylaspartate ammonia-lyase